MHPRSAGLRLRLHATSGTESGACVAARLPSGRPPSLHHLRHRFVVGFVRGFPGTMRPSDSSPLPRRLRLLGFPSWPGPAVAVWGGGGLPSSDAFPPYVMGSQTSAERLPLA